MPDMDGFEVAECIESERIAEPNEDEIPAQIHFNDTDF
jgi:hypothetical protein